MIRGMLRAQGIAICASMAATLSLLCLDGRWQEAIPLHLCSVSALVCASLAFFPRRAGINFLWYLGMPGAALALLFPAPAVSSCQALMNLSYAATHALIVLIPATALALGLRPEKGKAIHMLLVLLILAAAAALVNRRLGTNFLFLSAPPAGTPLELAFALGNEFYLVTLFALALGLLLTMHTLLCRLFQN